MCTRPGDPSVVESRQCTPARKINLSIAVSTVTGRFMLKPDHTTRNYSIKQLVPSCLPRSGCRGRELGSIDNCYNLLLYIVMATSASLLFHYVVMNCWLILPPCCKTHRKMLVFDRTSIFPLTLVLLSCSPLYNLPFPFDTCIKA